MGFYLPWEDTRWDGNGDGDGGSHGDAECCDEEGHDDWVDKGLDVEALHREEILEEERARVLGMMVTVDNCIAGETTGVCTTEDVDWECDLVRGIITGWTK